MENAAASYSKRQKGEIGENNDEEANPLNTMFDHKADEDFNPLSFLPEEIVLQILLWLPVKTLLRFKCVCKCWCAEISSSVFAKTHLHKRMNNNEDNRHTQLILRCISRHNSERGVKLKQYPVNSFLYAPPGDASDLVFPLKKQLNSWYMLGSCNGLFCMRLRCDIILWNPATRKRKTLPRLPSNMPHNSRHLFGLGYDEKNDDYKVVLGSSRRVNGESVKSMYVYSLRTDSWRKITNFFIGGVNIRASRHVNGKLHWIFILPVQNDSSNNGIEICRWVIFSFDLATETTKELALPNLDGDLSYTHPRLSLDVLRDKLCLICPVNNRVTDVWMMKEYDVEESWTKLATIPCEIISDNGFVPSVICIGKNGEIVVKASGYKSAAIYDVKSGIITNPKIHNAAAPAHVFTIVESLVSLYPIPTS